MYYVLINMLVLMGGRGMSGGRGYFGWTGVCRVMVACTADGLVLGVVVPMLTLQQINIIKSFEFVSYL